MDKAIFNIVMVLVMNYADQEHSAMILGWATKTTVHHHFYFPSDCKTYKVWSKSSKVRDNQVVGLLRWLCQSLLSGS
jgi:hypothetical protein